MAALPRAAEAVGVPADRQGQGRRRPPGLRARRRGDMLMILDADLTVPPEDLPVFYDVAGRRARRLRQRHAAGLPDGAGGDALLQHAGQHGLLAGCSPTCCSSRSRTRCAAPRCCGARDYERLAANRAYFGDFDPFGDFDLIFGAAKLNLKIAEIPIRYRDRTYGETNIQRWKHGWLLLQDVGPRRAQAASSSEPRRARADAELSAAQRPGPLRAAPAGVGQQRGAAHAVRRAGTARSRDELPAAGRWGRWRRAGIGARLRPRGHPRAGAVRRGAGALARPRDRAPRRCRSPTASWARWCCSTCSTTCRRRRASSPRRCGCCGPGGRVVLCEPYVSPLSFPVYKLLARRALRPAASIRWRRRHVGRPGRDPFDSNQAIPTLLFGRRARARSPRRFPRCGPRASSYLAGPSYPASGGFSRGALLPWPAWSLLHRLESRLPGPVARLLAFRMLIVLERAQPADGGS